MRSIVQAFRWIAFLIWTKRNVYKYKCTSQEQYLNSSIPTGTHLTEKSR